MRVGGGGGGGDVVENILHALGQVGAPGVAGEIEGGAEDDAEDEDGVEDVRHSSEYRSGMGWGGL